jgi:hypothetical protein
VVPIYIFIHAALVPGLAEDIFIDPSPELMVVLFVPVSELNPVDPPTSALALTSPNTEAEVVLRVRVPAIDEFPT